MENYLEHCRIIPRARTEHNLSTIKTYELGLNKPRARRTLPQALSNYTLSTVEMHFEHGRRELSNYTKNNVHSRARSNGQNIPRAPRKHTWSTVETYFEHGRKKISNTVETHIELECSITRAGSKIDLSKVETYLEHGPKNHRARSEIP